MTSATKIKLKVLPTGKTHISFSELSDWIACGWRHKLKQIDKLYEQVPSPIPTFGTIVHSANEDFLKTRIMKIELAIENLRKTWDNCRSKTKEELKLDDVEYEDYLRGFNEIDQKKFEQEAKSILEEIPQFMDINFPNWEFIDAEHQLYETLDDLPYAFKGYIDGVIRCDGKRKNSKVIWLIDWKTSDHGWSREKREDQLIKNQVVFYKHFYAKKNNLSLKDIRCAFIILKRKAKPGTRCDLFTVSVGDTSINKALKYVRNMLSSIEDGKAFKNKFNCMWCDFFNTEYCDAKFRTIK